MVECVTAGMTLEDSEVEHTALDARRTPDRNRSEWPEEDDNDARLPIRRSLSSEVMRAHKM